MKHPANTSKQNSLLKLLHVFFSAKTNFNDHQMAFLLYLHLRSVHLLSVSTFVSHDGNDKLKVMHMYKCHAHIQYVYSSTNTRKSNQS